MREAGKHDMSAGEAKLSDRRYIADIFRSHWLLFTLVGALLIVAGLVAITRSFLDCTE
jgi:uncharacterized membrane protein HdeD (DUF308 family)